MARIFPFHGLRYSTKQVGDINNVVSPPYDVISSPEAAGLKSRSEYNAVHIDLPRITDPEAEFARYKEAGRLFRTWIGEGVLQAENEAAIYVYRQTYKVPGSGENRTLLGFIAALELVHLSEGVVLPHEHTFAKPKADRLNLMRATGANLSPVYSFYSDPQNRIEAAVAHLLVHKPQAAAVDDNGDTHEVWVATGSEVAVAQAVLADIPVFIADGHHRYETALDYKAERAAETPQATAAWQTVMMMLVNLDAGGLTILPTHRVLHNISTPDLTLLRQKLASYFIIRELKLTSAAEAAQYGNKLQPGSFAAYVAPGCFWLLDRVGGNAVVSAISVNRSQAWKELDVTVLHRLVLEGVLGLSRESLDRQENISYTRDVLEACAAVDSGAATMAFLLPSPTVTAVKDVALAGDVMPHKSTYFYPKLLTGLVFSDLNKSLA